MMPSVTGAASAVVNPSQPPTATPAEKNAKTGTANPADRGRTRCSRCSASSTGSPEALAPMTGTAKPSSTPATVAWIPASWTRAHVITASGTRITHAAHVRCAKKRGKRCARNPNTASGMSARSSGSACTSSV